MTDEQPYVHEDGKPWTSDELADELRDRGLKVSGTASERLERLEADDRGDTPENTHKGAPPAALESVAEQWATYQRPDQSRYLVCLVDVSDLPDDQRPRTAPESPDHVRLAPSNTP